MGQVGLRIQSKKDRVAADHVSKGRCLQGIACEIVHHQFLQILESLAQLGRGKFPQVLRGLLLHLVQKIRGDALAQLLGEIAAQLAETGLDLKHLPERAR